MQQRNTL